MVDYVTFPERLRYRTYHFPVVVDGDFKFDMSRVYPIQQRLISEIVGVLNTYCIKGVVVLFGSSITPLCYGASDVDLAFDLCEGMSAVDCLALSDIHNLCKNGLDVVDLHLNWDRQILASIRRGLTIYESLT